MQYEMSLIPEAFESMQRGKKKIDVRVNDEKRRQLCPGDQIVVYKLPDSLESILVEVSALYPEKSFAALYAAHPAAAFGYGELTVDALLDLTYQYYCKEKEEQYGVVGIAVRLL